MRKIPISAVQKALETLIRDAHFIMRADLKECFLSLRAREEESLARFAFDALLSNARIAREHEIALCQDTGFPIVFVELGQNVTVTGGPLEKAIQDTVAASYKKYKLRRSVVQDPLFRDRAPSWGPAAIYYKIVSGSKIKIVFVPKGFGSENVTRLKMFLPGEGPEGIKKFVVDILREIGPNACPPYVIGIGVGGDSIKALMLAKEALLVPIEKQNPDKRLACLEKTLKEEVNRLRIGACGFGGKSTCIAVKILTYPTHIAGLPVGINISCHALRNVSVVL